VRRAADRSQWLMPWYLMLEPLQSHRAVLIDEYIRAEHAIEKTVYKARPEERRTSNKDKDEMGSCTPRETSCRYSTAPADGEPFCGEVCAAVWRHGRWLCM